MKIGISTIGSAGDILPMVEYGRRLERDGHEVSYKIFALMPISLDVETIALDFNLERFINKNINWYKPFALSCLLHEAISKNYSLICNHLKELADSSDTIVNHYFLKPMQGIAGDKYSSFSLNPAVKNSKIPEVMAARAIGKYDHLAVDECFGGTGYYYSGETRQLDITPMQIFMGFGSVGKFINPIEYFKKIESAIGQRCIIQGRDVSTVDYQDMFNQCKAVIHHGGVGTTHIATKAKVKQFICPLHGENLYWANKVEEMGIGKNIINSNSNDIARLINEI